jgi:hypothetical protein
MNWKAWFKSFGNHIAAERIDEDTALCTTQEEQYQAIKARLIEETTVCELPNKASEIQEGE